MMKQFSTFSKPQRGDKVAILSPSFAAPGKWPHIYELGLRRLREEFGLEPVEFPATKKIGASRNERSSDLIAAFEDPSIKAVIATLGGNDQVTYIKNLPEEPFKNNPKPFFGYSDNSHFMNFLWLHGIPSYYGGALFTQFAEPGSINEFTKKYLSCALFETGIREIEASPIYHDGENGLDWENRNFASLSRNYQPNDGWYWSGSKDAEGVSWGGCLESIDEMLRHGIKIPSLSDFESIILLTETSEEIPRAEYVFRVYRALGERGILERVKAILVGRPKAWEFHKQWDTNRKKEFRERQRETIEKTVRQYNPEVTIVQNMDFGHTDPQIPFPYGGKIQINAEEKKIHAAF